MRQRTYFMVVALGFCTTAVLFRRRNMLIVSTRCHECTAEDAVSYFDPKFSPTVEKPSVRLIWLIMPTTRGERGSPLRLNTIYPTHDMTNRIEGDAEDDYGYEPYNDDGPPLPIRNLLPCQYELYPMIPRLELGYGNVGVETLRQVRSTCGMEGGQLLLTLKVSIHFRTAFLLFRRRNTQVTQGINVPIVAPLQCTEKFVSIIVLPLSA
jgi:hypothetical protein